jgi:ribonuclease III
VLGFLVAEALLQRFPEMDEGGLSKFKAFLVSRPNLAAVARSVGLGSYFRLGKTAERGQGRIKESFLADGLEAVIAAVHLDGGDAAARALVGALFGKQIAALDREEVEGQDYKTSLQEALQAGGWPTPRYRVESNEGPPHRPLFHISVLVEGKVMARGAGGSKKEAEQNAARLALRRLRKSPA